MEIDYGDLLRDVDKVKEYLKANTNIREDLDLNDVFGRLEAASSGGRRRELVQKKIIKDLGLKMKKVNFAPVPKLAVKPSQSAEIVNTDNKKRKRPEPFKNEKPRMGAKKLKICNFASVSLFGDFQNTMTGSENPTLKVKNNDAVLARSATQHDENVMKSEFRQKPNIAEVITNEEVKPSTPKSVSDNGGNNAKVKSGVNIGETFIEVSDDEEDFTIVNINDMKKGSSAILSSSTASRKSNPADRGSTFSSKATSSATSGEPSNPSITNTSSEVSFNLSSLPGPSTGGSLISLPTSSTAVSLIPLDEASNLDMVSLPGLSTAPMHPRISTRSKSFFTHVSSHSDGPESVAKQLADMFPHFSSEYLLEKAKMFDTVENAIDELLKEADVQDSLKRKGLEMKIIKERVAKSLLLLGEGDLFKKVMLTEKRDFNPDDPLENKFRLAKGHYLSVSGHHASPIQSIEYVENRTLMEIFEKKKSEFRAEGKDTKEYFLFHGTNNVNVDSILKNNFRMDLAGRHGQAYGRGIYFSEKTDIPNKYMNGTRKTLLLCRVLLGREFLGPELDIPQGFDSKSVQPDQEHRANINIVKEVDQILPCFVLNLDSGVGVAGAGAPGAGPGAGTNMIQFTTQWRGHWTITLPPFGPPNPRSKP